MAGALGVLLVALAVAYVLKVAQQDKSLLVPQSLPKNVNQQLSGYTFTRSEGGRQIFTVHAARTMALKEGGKTLLEDVTVEVFGRTGSRHDSLKTNQCDYTPETGGLSCLGKVEIQLKGSGDSAPGSGFRGRQTVHLETSKVSYEPKESLVVSESPVSFRYGPASGSAVGFQYDTASGWMELKHDVLLDLPSFGGLASPLRVAASGLNFEKEEARVLLRGPLQITQGTRRVLAGGGTIFLDQQNGITAGTVGDGVWGSDSSPANALEMKARRVNVAFDAARSQLQTLVADGDVQVESRRGGRAAGSETSLSRLSAQHLDVRFISEGSQAVQPLAGTASGDVRISSQSRPAPKPAASAGTAPKAAGRGSAERNELAASQVQFEFSAGGRGLREAKTIGPGELVVIPADPGQGRRVITAGQFVMRFDEQSHLQNLRGLSHAKVVVEPAAGRPAVERQETLSDELEAKFDPATQELATLAQTGNFQFRQGERQVTADRAFYTSQDRLLTLTGRPLLRDPGERMRAEQFWINVGRGTAEGSGRVESTYFERPVALPSAVPLTGSGDHAQTGIKSGDTVNVLADRVVAERDGQLLHYEGHVRAWSGYDVIESPSLDIYRRQRRIVSGSGVVTSHMPPPAPSASTVPDSRTHGVGFGGAAPVTIRADRLEYLDEGREATYRGHVEVTTGDATLRADSVQAFFSSPSEVSGGSRQGARLERVVAGGHVTVNQPGRRATGDRAEYSAGAGKIVMTGGPPSLYDERNGFTTGQSLTFYIGDDSLFVDGGEASPTLLKRHLTR